MNQYNKKWTREKFLEYRKLKRNGYSHDMLIEHFGDDIYYSGIYNRNAHIIPYDIFMNQIKKINEIKINPVETTYDVSSVPSNLYFTKNDYLITFMSNDVLYKVCLMYYKINDYDTYNIVFTTAKQWDQYKDELYNISKKSNVDSDEWELLNNIISKETNLNDIFPIFRKLSWILFDFCSKYIKDEMLSITDTTNEKKIKLYRNIIKDSFSNISEIETTLNGIKYFIYKMN